MNIVEGSFGKAKKEAVKDEQGFPTRPIKVILQEILDNAGLEDEETAHCVVVIDPKKGGDLILTSTYTPLELNMALDILKMSVVEAGLEGDL